MNSQPKLKIDWCSHDAAKYACTRWHYSKALPAGKLVKIGVWEDEKFKGAIIYSHGANQYIGSPYGLPQTKAVELTRIALTNHSWPVSKMMAMSLKFLKHRCPLLRLVVSYADADQNHHGGIYQATNWVYVGLHKTNSRTAFIIHGKKTHPRTVATRGVKQSISDVRQHLDANATEFFSAGKHKYLMPLDNAMAATVSRLKKPYPKRAGSAGSGILGNQPGGGGATPTSALLQLEE